MKASPFHIAIFKSRIGKRIFAMFVGCSFLPIAILTVLSYLHVEDQLKDQASARLRQTTKAIGMSIYERLEFLESELNLVFHSLPEDAPRAFPPVRPTSGNDRQRRFDGILFQHADGRSIPLLGQMDHPPAFTADEVRDLRAGRTHIRIITKGNRPALIQMSAWAVSRNNPPGILVGEVNPSYLWGIGEQSSLPPSTELSIMDQTGRVLISSLPTSPGGIPEALDPVRDTSSHHFVWQTGDQLYLASYWDLFLKSRFAADTWTIVLSQKRNDALAAIHRFKFDFPLVLLVGFWIILLVSIRFIRKSIDPLEKLQNATRLIQRGDFSQPVDIRSGDEFEDLAVSFNTMVTRLARTFGELSVMAEMGRFVTTRPEVTDLVRTQLRIMEERLHFDWGVLMVGGHVLSDAPLIAGFGLSRHSGSGAETIVRLDHDPRIRGLMKHAENQSDIVFTNHIGELSSTLPAEEMALLERIACRSLICVPLKLDHFPIGLLAVGNNRGAAPLTENDKHLLIGIASQTAVAIDSMLSYNKLEASEARFREAFEHAATGIALVTVDFCVKASNRYLQQLLGYSAAELAAKRLQDLSLKEDEAIGNDALDRLLSGDLPFTQYEKRYQHKNGDPIWVRINASLMRNASGNVQQFIFHIRDLTAEKAAEKDKRRLENQLRQAQKMEAMGTLAGGIAHDFNNILSAVGGYTELALMQLPPEAEVRGNLEQVKKAADRATNLVRQILTFSRQAEHEKIPLRMDTVVKEALQLLRASLPATIEIRKVIEGETVSVLADPTQIHQIVMNLCTNAMHAMQENGGILDVDLRPIVLSTEDVAGNKRIRAGSYLRLTVADTGCGMDTRTRERIFDPYFTTKTKDKGTGLGLAVVHGIVDSHQGFIEVASKLGEGTRFDVYFPIVEDQCLSKGKPEAKIRRGSGHILFVDDEPMLVEIGKSMLKRQGYTVAGMTDPAQALEIFRQSPRQFDIVITDLTMPGIRGDRLAEKIAAVRPDMPILLCSGYMHAIENPHVTGYIHKPIQMQELNRAVRDALDRRGTRATGI